METGECYLCGWGYDGHNCENPLKPCPAGKYGSLGEKGECHECPVGENKLLIGIWFMVVTP